MTDSLKVFEERWPMIEWHEPITITWPSTVRYSCRICIAAYGIKKSSQHQWLSEQEVRDHIKKEHA